MSCRLYGQGEHFLQMIGGDDRLPKHEKVMYPTENRGRVLELLREHVKGNVVKVRNSSAKLLGYAHSPAIFRLAGNSIDKKMEFHKDLYSLGCFVVSFMDIWNRLPSHLRTIRPL